MYINIHLGRSPYRVLCAVEKEKRKKSHLLGRRADTRWWSYAWRSRCARSREGNKNGEPRFLFIFLSFFCFLYFISFFFLVAHTHSFHHAMKIKRTRVLQVHIYVYRRESSMILFYLFYIFVYWIFHNSSNRHGCRCRPYSRFQLHSTTVAADILLFSSPDNRSLVQQRVFAPCTPYPRSTAYTVWWCTTIGCGAKTKT